MYDSGGHFSGLLAYDSVYCMIVLKTSRFFLCDS